MLGKRILVAAIVAYLLAWRLASVARTSSSVRESAPHSGRLR